MVRKVEVVLELLLLFFSVWQADMSWKLIIVEAPFLYQQDLIGSKR